MIFMGVDGFNILTSTCTGNQLRAKNCGALYAPYHNFLCSIGSCDVSVRAYKVRDMKRLLLVLFLLFVQACSDPTEEMDNDLINLSGDSGFPRHVVGVLYISVESGDVHDDGISSINFGTLKTQKGTIGVDLTEKVIRESGLIRDDLFKNLKVNAVVVESEYGDSQSDLKSYMIQSMSVEE